MCLEFKFHWVFCILNTESNNTTLCHHLSAKFGSKKNQVDEGKTRLIIQNGEKKKNVKWFAQGQLKGQKMVCRLRSHFSVFPIRF